MKKIKLISLLLSGYCAVTLVRCTPDGTIAGGASDTEISAQIEGTATDVTGNAIAGALIELRLKEYLPGTQSVGKQLALYSRIDAETDDTGHFALDSVEEGVYTLMIRSGDTIGTTTECEVTQSSKLNENFMLKPFGAVDGWVNYSYESPGFIPHGKVECAGTELMTRPDSTGYFRLPLPEGRHHLRMSVDSAAFDEMWVDVQVVPSMNKNIGVIRLTYMPVSACWDGMCDSTVLRKFLDDAGHQEVKISDVATWKYGRIAVLNLRGLPIDILLAPLGRLSNIEVLDLGNTGTADSCRFLCGLWNLQVLRLDGNNITGLSHCIEGLFRLQELDISGNRLTALPVYISRLTPVRKLNLAGNALCYITPQQAAWADVWNPGWRDSQICQ